MQFRTILTLAFAFTMSTSSIATEVKAGSLIIDQARARTTVPHQPSGAAYITIENKGAAADKLLSAASPIAKSVQLHTMSMDGNVMKMREVAEIEIKPQEKIVMQAGHGYHVMLIGLKQQLKAGEKFPLTLNFQKSGKVELTVQVEELDAKSEKKMGMH